MKSKSIVLILTAVLLLFAILLTWHDEVSTSDLFHIKISVGQGKEQIACWEDSEEQCYVFLPSYAELSDVQILLHTETPVTIGGNVLVDGMRCDFFSLDTPYDLVYNSFGKRYERKITFMQSGGVSAMYINTESGSMDYIHDKKGNEESGVLNLYNSEGNLDYAGKLLSIHGRGNVTWTDKEKKPYSLKLSEEADLLGMGNAQKWILLANAFDASNLRNKVVFDFAGAVGLAYSPDSAWVDLYLNGEYAGLYLLCERNEVHPQRVDIAHNGSFLVSVELESRLIAQNYSYIATEAKQALRVHYPLEASGEYLDELMQKWQSVENALLSEDGIDPVTGKLWMELIDLDSWVKKYLMEEIFGSIDACILSQFFYCDGNDSSGKVYAGPVWDFDKSMGTYFEWEIANPNTLYANQIHSRAGLTTPWFFCLYQKEEFYNRVVEMYQTEFLPRLESMLGSGIRDYAAQISRASMMNQIRWPGSDTDFFEEVDYIADYMSKRIGFLRSVWCDQIDYYFVKADYGYDCSYAVLPGECVSGLYEFEDTDYSVFLGWYYTDTDEPFDISQPITEDVEIYAKWEDSPSKRLGQIVKLKPLGVIAVMGVVFLVIDIKRMRKSR